MDDQVEEDLGDLDVQIEEDLVDLDDQIEEDLMDLDDQIEEDLRDLNEQELSDSDMMQDVHPEEVSGSIPFYDVSCYIDENIKNNDFPTDNFKSVTLN